MILLSFTSKNFLLENSLVNACTLSFADSNQTAFEQLKKGLQSFFSCLSFLLDSFFLQHSLEHDVSLVCIVSATTG